MASFYDNLWRKEMPKAEAFRQAQLAMLRGELATAMAKDSRGIVPGRACQWLKNRRAVASRHGSGPPLF